MQIDSSAVVQVVGWGVFLWLGLYLLTRSTQRSLTSGVILLGLFAQAAFFLSGALANNRPTLGQLVRLERWFWWSSVVPVAAWFWARSLIHQTLLREARRRSQIERGVVAVAALILILVGNTTNLLLDFARPQTLGSGAQTVGAGPWYLGFVGFVVLTAVGAAAHLAQAARAAQAQEPIIRRHLWALTAGAALFGVGAVILGLRFAVPLTFSPALGYGWILLGLLATGVSLARFALLLDGQNVRRDLLHSLSEMLLLQAIYIGLLSQVIALDSASLAALVGLIALTHTTLDRGRSWLDRLFFRREERLARTESRRYTTVLGTTPVARPAEAAPSSPPAPSGPPPKAWNDHVRRAISGLKNPPQLASNPLLASTLVEQQLLAAQQADTRLNRVAGLRELLIAQIEGLRPGGEAGAGEAWRFYNVLYYPYVREINRKTAINEVRRLHDERRRAGVREPTQHEHMLIWLADIDEDTFYKWQRKASDMIAANLWESGGNVVE
jgi:hypothetical protein